LGSLPLYYQVESVEKRKKEKGDGVMAWDEKKFHELQINIEHMNLDGGPVSLDEGARALMAAYYVGVIVALTKYVSGDEIRSRVSFREDMEAE